MAVRVKIRIRYGNREAETSALVNSGYEADEPEIHIPIALARKLGLPLENVESRRYSVVGAEVSAYVLDYVYVRVETSDRRSRWIRARAVTVPGEYEVLLSDALIEELGIEIVKAKQGLWRFHGEEGVRESVEPRYWVS